MWILKSPQGQVYHLLNNKEYSIGRKGTDIIVSQDASVSRCHCIVSVNSEGKPLVQDQSKFGSFWAKDEGSIFEKIVDSKVVSDGELFRVGVHSVFKVKKEIIKVMYSLIQTSNLKKLQNTLSILGYTLLKSWSNDVNYLVMDKIKMNIKVSTALVIGCDIVTANFFDDWLFSYKQKTSLPSPNSYLPEVDEKSLDLQTCSFLKNVSRKNVFLHKTFIFFDKTQMKKLKSACTFGGGKILHANSSICDLKLATDSSTIAISPLEELDLSRNERLLFQQTKTQIFRSKLRVIPEHEIALAILYCCSDVYCNPALDLSQFMNSESNKLVKTQTLEIKETCPSNSLQNKSLASVISETDDEDDDPIFSLGDDISSSSRPLLQKHETQDSITSQSWRSDSIKSRSRRIAPALSQRFLSSDEDEDEEQEFKSPTQNLISFKSLKNKVKNEKNVDVLGFTSKVNDVKMDEDVEVEDVEGVKDVEEVEDVEGVKDVEEVEDVEEIEDVEEKIEKKIENLKVDCEDEKENDFEMKFVFDKIKSTKKQIKEEAENCELLIQVVLLPLVKQKKDPQEKDFSKKQKNFKKFVKSKPNNRRHLHLSSEPQISQLLPKITTEKSKKISKRRPVSFEDIDEMSQVINPFKKRRQK